MSSAYKPSDAKDFQAKQLAIDDLPPGVDAVCGHILTNGSDGAIWIRDHRDAPWDLATSASMENRPSRLRIDPVQRSVLPREYRRSTCLEVTGGVTPSKCTLFASLIRRTYATACWQPHTQIELKPGGSQRIDITMERSPEFRGIVTLDVMPQHLEPPYGNPLPKRIRLDRAPRKTLLTGTESVGDIALKAAADPPCGDASGTDHRPYFHRH